MTTGFECNPWKNGALSIIKFISKCLCALLYAISLVIGLALIYYGILVAIALVKL